MSPPPLTALRTSLGFTLEEVALMARWPARRQAALEHGAEMLAEEADLLTALLGADVEELAEGDLPPRPLARLLKGQAADLDAEARFSLAEAATVAREVQDLRRYLPAAVHLSPSVTVFQTALSARAGPPPGGLLAVLERIQIRDPVRVCWHPRQGECAFSLAYFHNFQ